MSEKLQLEKKVFIKGKIITKTGIHIGGSSLGLQIGGADNVVIRNPITNLPYIPGSSLKGKMRSLLEKSLGLIQPKQNSKGEWEGKLCTDPNEDVVQLFGAPAEKLGQEPTHAPTRLTVRDGDLLNGDKLATAENTDMYCTEIKTEVNIDRLTSAANPRNFERVPAGAEFRLDLVLDIYNVDIADDEKRSDEFVKLIKQGLLLIEDDYLGGHGTRGYGQVEFHIDSVTERTADDYRNGVSNLKDSDFANTFSCFMNRQQAEA
ncbi:MAG: type III-A CRISPR-associated RAMP protein Csm3 [Deltaproteobacteria bacterium]|nr:type III-A CRISPR-associated RAMP protein Csm3 [Deltaproteobacteria bacterium]MBW2020962.1 type III-A CRISPR-associated RAMP protein Csm3 [Deltaproteobacteria bacterium]MBW2098670.1 type III-A CRISPR-associated RAMP protein Csm3 [Deltaproteobacteria bacterium]